MKKYVCIILVAFIALFQSCSSDFTVGAPYKDYTVVFGLLARSDSAHYIKITKGFYDETQNNLIVAQNPDSLYYKDIEVKIHEMNNGNIVKTFVLDKVDLKNEGYVKDTGVFASNPSFAYKFKTTLDASKIYKLVVKNTVSGKEIYAETNIIDNTKMNIEAPLSINNERINFSSFAQTARFSWRAPSTVSIFDIGLLFRYEEINNITQDTVFGKSVYVPLETNFPNTGASSLSVFVKTETFYSNLQAAIGIAPAHITRLIDTPDVVVLGGGTELKKYMDITASQGGITYDQIKPTHTNLVGDAVFGLLSTRATNSAKNVLYSDNTVLGLINSSYTKNLNFIGRSIK